MNRKLRRQIRRPGTTTLPMGEALDLLVEHYQGGRMEEAEHLCRRVLDSRPDDADVLFLAADVYLRRGRAADSVDLLHRLLARDPGHAEAYFALGNALMVAAKPALAAEAYAKALARSPDRPELHFNLGNARQAAGEFDGAARSYQRAVEIRPDYPEALLNLGNLARAAGITGTAITLYRRAAEAQPDYAEAWNNLGNTLRQAGAPDAAVEALERALAIRDHFPEAWNNLGNARLAQGDAAGAVAAYKRALEAGGAHPEILANLGQALVDAGAMEEALSCAEQALALNAEHDPAAALRFHLVQHLCAWDRWDEAEGHVARLTATALEAGRKPAETPFIHVSRVDDGAANLAVARAWGREISARVSSLAEQVAPSGAARDDGRLVVGYLSNDFHDHATAHLMQSAFGLHDRGAYVVNAYSTGPDDGSAYRARIARDCDSFVDIRSLDSLSAAARIRDDGVHILVDLKGWTQGSRLEISALRPAPIQVSYLGFPGTTGADFFDYLITDRMVTPDSLAPHFSESLIRLPQCYQVTDYGQPIDPAPIARRDEGLPNTGPVFCSFNRSFKLDPVLFDVWMALLKAVPDSTLWLFAEGTTVRDNLRREATHRGIDADRLVFSDTRPKPLHLARMTLADVALDTRLYGGHTTTSDALWAGVPVVTLEGRHFASRVSASILTAAGMPDLVTGSLEAYQDLAATLARDPAALAAVKDRLSSQREAAPLFDTPLFVRDLERAYKAIWARHAVGRAPTRLDLDEAD